MKVNAAIILCAGYGKRVNPLTLECPKPLLKINKKTLLQNTIMIIKKLGIKKIYINSFYLKNKLKDYLKKNNFGVSINIVDDGKNILGTGGGIKNILSNSKEQNFIIFNPDTIWDKVYLKYIKSMKEIYERRKLQNILLVVERKLSFDKSLKGDFCLANTILFKKKINDYIYTGCQILNKETFNNIKKKKFSIQFVWNNQLKKKCLNGFESKNIFYHITDLKIYKNY